MRAVGYLRVSSEMQVDNWSIDAQERAVREYCHAKGWTLTQLYVDEGRSARSDSIASRPEMRRLMQDCRNRNFDVVIVQQLDRWARNLRVMLETFNVLSDHRVAFASVTENIDYSTPEGRLFTAMLGAFAQYFSDSLSKHTSKAKRERVMQGLYNGDLPFGYRRSEDGIPTLIEDEAEVVQNVFARYSTGQYSYHQLATEVNSLGFKTRNKRKSTDYGLAGPRPFSKESIKDIVNNPYYAGLVRYKGGDLMLGKHQGIVERSLWEQCQDVKDERRKGSKRTSGRYRPYLLKGLLRCVYCGQRLWAQTGRNGAASYREFSSHRGIPCQVGQGYIGAEVMDNATEKLIQSLTLPESWQIRVLDILSSDMQRTDIEHSRALLKERLRRLSKAYIDGLVTDKEYEIQKQEIQIGLDRLVSPQETETITAGNYITDLAAIWQEADTAERWTILSRMLDAVYCDVEQKTLVGIKPKPPFVPIFTLVESLIGPQEASSAVIGDPEGIRTLDLHRDRVAC